MALHWMLAWYVISQWNRTSIAKKPYIFVIFQGGPDPLSSPLDSRINIKKTNVDIV